MLAGRINECERKGQKGHIGQNGSPENRIDYFAWSKVSMKRIGANKYQTKSEPEMLMDRQWHWDTRLEHPYEEEYKQTFTPPTNH